MKKFNKTLEEIITFQNYFDALKECNKEVNYKFSVQEYDFNCIQYITDTIDVILSGKIPNVKQSRKVTIFERGKKRIITPIDIADRITQKVLCDHVLVPAIIPHLVTDNGASMKGKGTNYARKRVNMFIESAKREYGNDNVYALVFDFKGFFDSIPHKECYRVLKKYISDERIINLTIGIILSYKLNDIQKIQDVAEREKELSKLYNLEDVGICLGSQISQIMAVAVPNGFDHYIKDFRHMKYYYRHMDDGIILFNDKATLQKLKTELENVANKYGLKFNDKKTYVTKVTKGFCFLKVKYRIESNDCGKTIKKLDRRGIVKERQKLKKFVPKVNSKAMTMDDVYASIQSWNEHSKIANSYHTTKSMMKLYNELFDGYRMTRKYYRRHQDELLKERKRLTQNENQRKRKKVRL